MGVVIVFRMRGDFGQDTENQGLMLTFMLKLCFAENQQFSGKEGLKFRKYAL